ncbi:MAG: type II toxin-antitoxin system PemK/MazF family toxin [Gaiellaceae bacterium]
MPLPVAELRRGRVVLALFPFASSFPLRTADGRTLTTVEDFARSHRGAATGVVAEGRIRPVLLLHDRTRGEHGDVLCLRISSVKAPMRESESWPRLVAQEHPLFLHLPPTARYGLREESVIALSSIGAVHKSAIAGRAPVGTLDHGEMRIVSERLARLLSLDLGPLVAAQARELVLRLAKLRNG